VEGKRVEIPCTATISPKEHPPEIESLRDMSSGLVRWKGWGLDAGAKQKGRIEEGRARAAKASTNNNSSPKKPMSRSITRD